MHFVLAEDTNTPFTAFQSVFIGSVQIKLIKCCACDIADKYQTDFLGPNQQKEKTKPICSYLVVKETLCFDDS